MCNNANLDIDECLDRSHGCQQICINLPGTFACTCEKGFSTDANEIDCTDNDECALRSHNCHVNAGMNLIGCLLISAACLPVVKLDIVYILQSISYTLY